MAFKEKDEKTGRATDGKFLPGYCPPGGGRPKGRRNAITVTSKMMLEEAVLQLGGIEWLIELGRADPKALLGAWSKATISPPLPSADDDTSNPIAYDPDSDIDA